MKRWNPLSRLGVASAIAALSISASTMILAAPAAPSNINYQQPNGAVVSVTGYGDEWFGWWETSQGDVLVRNAVTQYLEYANALQSGGKWQLVPSGVTFGGYTGGMTLLTPEQVMDYWKVNKLFSVSSENYVYQAGAVNGESQPDTVGEAAAASGGAVSRPLLLVMISFTDQQIQSSDASWYNKFFPVSFGSVNHYFNEATYGQFQVHPANESYGSANDGIVRATLNYAHPNPGRSSQQDMLKAALDQIDQYVDFSQYDTDNDGHVSAEELQLGFIVAGGESAILGEDVGVWAHVTAFGSAYRPVMDGVDVAYTGYGRYFRVGEKHKNNDDASIGIIAHEMGHSALFLPDLYDTSEARGISYWGIMGQGMWGRKSSSEQLGDTPTHYSAWSKMTLGVVTPQVATMSTAGETFNLYEVTSNNYNVVKVPTQNQYEYFLLENRQNTGYDLGVTRSATNFYDNSTGGIAIWHINENANGPSRVMLERAIPNEYASLVTDLFWSGNVDAFGPNTSPASTLVDGTETGVNITNIGSAGLVMSVTVSQADSSVLCEATSATLDAHVTAGRAYKTTTWNGFYYVTSYRAVGSDVTLGSYGWTTVTLKQTDDNYYESGACVAPQLFIDNITPLGADGVTAVGRSVETDDDIVSTEYRLNGSGAWQPTNGLQSWTVQLTGLANGNYTLNVRTTDAGGRVVNGSDTFQIGQSQSLACVTADNLSHVAAGRAVLTGPSTLRKAAAVGSGDDLGYAMTYLNNYSTVLETSSGYWEKVSLCP